ncbi:hypothetical protein QJS04_geneDACA012783 [Acorus gramineus]|uniref:Uncharacterized protein n=1 Tax=Acorus gramineus TaxID=55184 RepID=A0AAV9BJX7_ACOGR|nr:hypothetical protein QJS04_geneDACA012783 [Acorus gramineus]
MDGFETIDEDKIAMIDLWEEIGPWANSFNPWPVMSNESKEDEEGSENVDDIDSGSDSSETHSRAA